MVRGLHSKATAVLCDCQFGSLYWLVSRQIMQSSSLPQSNDSMIGKLLVASTTVNDPVLSRSVSLVVHQDMENVFAVLLNRPMTPPPGLVPFISGGNVAGPNLSAPENSERTQIPDSESESNSESLQAESEGGFPTHMPSKAEMAKHTAASAAQALGPVHFGGPLSGPVVAVHDSSELAEAEAGRGIYVAAQRELLERLVKERQTVNPLAGMELARPGSFRLIVGHLGWSVEQLREECESGAWHVIDATSDDVFVGDVDLWPSIIRRATTRSVHRWLGIQDSPLAAEVN